MKLKKTLPNGVVIDIETSAWEALCYGNIYEPIVVKLNTNTQILSMSWRKVGSNKTYYIGQNSFKSYRPGKLNDRQLLVEISKVLSNFEYGVGHNGDDFDFKIIKERIMFHRLPPLPDIITLDTKKLIKGVSKLPSNKLEHVTEFLGNGEKSHEGGFNTFLGCMNGDPKAWKKNERYNKHDVDITHKDFMDMLPYVKLPNTYSRINSNDKCPINCSNIACLSDNLVRSKLRRNINGWKQQWQCMDCGKYTTDTRIIKIKKVKNLTSKK